MRFADAAGYPRWIAGFLGVPCRTTRPAEKNHEFLLLNAKSLGTLERIAAKEPDSVFGVVARRRIGELQ